MTDHGHDFHCATFAGGWECHRCHRCDLLAIPSIFGFLWPELLGRFFRRWRCPGSVQWKER